MQGRTILLIGGLAIITALLVYIAVTNQEKDKDSQITPTPTPEQLVETTPVDNVAKTVSLGFNPATIKGSSGQVNLEVNGGDEGLSGVQVELAYDPSVVSSITLADPANHLFGKKGNYEQLESKVDAKLARISYVIHVGLSRPEIKGNGSILTLNYTLKPGVTSPTQITFLNKTTVTTLRSKTTSILKETQPLTITP